MTNNEKVSNAYFRHSIMTSSPQELILMLYNGLVKNINMGISFINEKNIEKSNETLMKAQKIVIELKVSLDMKYEISKNLKSLYDFLYYQLVEANIKKDDKILIDISEIVIELRDAWETIVRNNEPIKKSVSGG